jgi:D-alanine--poly(phosphoribitol) ligase subunit 1
MPLMVGACCYILPESGIKPLKIIEYLQKHKITALSMVPSVLKFIERYMGEIVLSDLRYSFFSGDSLYYHHAVKWSRCVPNAVIHNFYGPTETTIVCTRYLFDPLRSEKESVNGIVPLGKPFPGMEFIIVDENNHEIIKGELCFTGKQVITGYLNGKNEEKFFDHYNKRYYKTGDIVSLNEQGDLVFYGRTDDQVKINGYRVELSEIEHEIQNITNSKCVVLVEKDKDQNTLLISFIESENGNDQDLRNALSKVLPEYMIPRKFIFLEEFPLNLNGKIDKKKIHSFLQ